MAVVIGSGQNAKIFVPAASASWNIDGIAQKGDYDNLLLLSFSIHDQEVIDIRRCFEETTHIFAFGRDINKTVLQVSLLMMLATGCTQLNYATIEDMQKAYSDNRVYKKLDSVAVTIDGLTLNGFLIEMNMGDVNPATKTSVVTFTFILDQEV